MAACFVLLFAFKGLAQGERRMTEGKVVEVNEPEEAKKHSPTRAMIYSAVLPGAGQVYNKKYWKIPIIYGGIGVSLYAASWNYDRYKVYSDAFDLRTDGDDNTIDEFDGVYSDEQLIQIQNYYRRNQEVSLIVAFAFYALNILDANVDAHLYSFDVSKSLTLNMQPTQFQFIDRPVRYSGISLNLNF